MVKTRSKSKKQQDYRCPTCDDHPAVRDRNEWRECEECRSTQGTVSELQIAHDSNRKWGHPIRENLRIQLKIIKSLGHKLLKADGRNSELEAFDNDPLNELIDLVQIEHENRNDVLKMPVQEFISVIKQADASTPDDDSFVPMKDVWQDRFSSATQCGRFLDKNPQIRSRKPSKNRRKVHLADWHNHWKEEDRKQSESLDVEGIEEYLDEKEARKTRERERKNTIKQNR